MSNGSFLIVDRRALSTAFWSAARLLEGFFFCSVVSSDPTPLKRVFPHLCLLSLLEELLLSLLFVTLLSRKVLVTSNLIDLLRVNARQIDLLGSGDNITRVDSSQRNTVNLEGTGNEKHAL
jgi:hypothetical protein